MLPFSVLDYWAYMTVHACLQCIASLTKMKIIDRDNHGAFDEHISDDNDGNDEASFDSGESAHKYLAGAPLFLCCFIDMI